MEEAMKQQEQTPEMEVKHLRDRSITMGVITIIGVLAALLISFVAISKSGERNYAVSVDKQVLHDKSTGSCVSGTASDLDCRITTRKTCTDRGGFWSQQGTCDRRDRVQSLN